MKVDTPETPDYGEAYREGYEADIATLPLRLGVEQAADQGMVYTDPETGKSYDFSQYGTKAERNQQAVDSQLQLLQGGADISRTLEKQRLTDELDLLPQYNQLNLDAQKAAYQASLDAGEEGMARQYKQQLEYLPQFNALQLQNQADAYRQSLDLTDEGAARNLALQEQLLPETNDLSLAEQKKGYLQSIADAEAANPEQAALRRQLLQQTLDDLSLGDQLNPSQQRSTAQNVRSAQASRGNILGPSASIEEAMALTGYGDQLKQQRQTAAISALGTAPLTANYSVNTAVNTATPQLQATSQLQNSTPSFQATTTSGPNLGAANVSAGNIFNYTNATAGQSGVDYNMDVWKTKNANAQQNANAMNSVIGSGAGLAASFI